MAKKKGRKSGGILIYCKNYLNPFIKILKSCPYYSWLEINKNTFNNHSEHIKVCAIYSPPETSNYYSNEIWDEMSTDILNYTSFNTPFLIIGDMNARTGILSDISNNDKFHTNSSVPERHITATTRNNCDQMIDANGSKLIDLCKSYDMQIVNGRSKGDRWGNFTHSNKNKGESTVDMAILSDTMATISNDFEVLPQPDYSDHSKNNNHHQ